jgi:hypothetical protein
MLNTERPIELFRHSYESGGIEAMTFADVLQILTITYSFPNRHRYHEECLAMQDLQRSAAGCIPAGEEP